ncbi:DUF4199 domain-containing protein [uncultured Gelidibacter sp.]|uniref:DUF4199 domain-containing protein n=1 Tax=uncultured Gelidibacter sp. TaxID=259318 RepID=UPI002612D2C0|nr:DUF4199 domain-containing protein [uncultured Gelidibacter sp.]
MGNIKIEIKWALLFVAMSLLWMVLEKLAGLHSTHIDKHMYLTNLFFIPAILVYIAALKDKKKKDYNGQMSYKQGFISGLIITAIVALFAPFTQWIISTIITPEYFPNVIAYSVKIGYHSSLEEAQAFFNLQNYMVQSVVGALVMGVVTAAVVAYFVRTKPTV